VRCPRCGNENPATNRFCGTCGASLVSASTSAGRTDNTTATSIRNSVAPPASAPTTAPMSAHRTAGPVSGEIPPITGPSFLGLNDPASRTGGNANPQRDAPHGLASRNLDYLLDDEDESRGMAGKIFLTLIALALALGFGYLRWRHEGLSALWSDLMKPATTQSSEASRPATDAPANAPDPSSPSSGPASGAGPSTGQPTGSSQPAAAAPDSSSTSTSTSSSAGTTAPPSASPSTSAPDAAADHATTAPPPAAATAAPADKPAEDDSGTAAAPSSEESDETAPAPKPAAKARPVSKPSAAKTFDQVTEAEKYIYGRGGVRQDCDRGMRMLRPAAEQSNPRAMISLGALYSTGVCAPRDLPTAYRWFALALRKQPDNQPLQENLQRLWAQMTQPERQLAVKLSQ
jgi:hypothetical protein